MLKNKKKTKQFFWDLETEQRFKELVERYDPLLTVSTAVLKVVKQAIKDNYLPGYVRQEKSVASNQLAKALDNMEKNTLTLIGGRGRIKGHVTHTNKGDS